ncbi:probable E3 ubiquitin-protein ligase TRIML1 [Gracilinanus agilis]|uniref:probable E3 ubiquitin-protein ligase TRIML1 n=1 Tax=Gracilinanus agilis TaxID=191870 RepID=UPI001CFD5894|nr:probable E3 ubiquitin-protein ligase TRIML1 [Gracilinanus agilis]
MEAKELIENFKVELTCSICLGYFTDPVIAKCGHSFCKDCLLQCDEQPDATLTCPECREVIRSSGIGTNKNLQNLSITGKALRQHLQQSMVLLTTCDQHFEREKLFCKQDQKLICDSCLITQDHKDHKVLPLKIAAKKCKKKLQKKKKILQEKKEGFKEAINELRTSAAYVKKKSNYIKDLIRHAYNEMHKFLWKEENKSLQELDQEIKEILTEFEKNENFLSQQIQHLEQRILETEESLDNAPLEMLQDMKGILKRNEELLLQKPKTVEFSYTICAVTGLAEILKSYKVDISLDPKTDSFHLTVPEEFKHLKYEFDSQDQPGMQEDYFVTVLGAQTFTSGTHYWEVNLEGQKEWVFGICEDSVLKNGNVSILFEDVIAIIALKVKNEILFWSPSYFFFQIPRKKVGILLNYEEGYVSFYDIKSRFILFSFSNSAFQGPVRPFFSTSCKK